jgi:hypothetical protein
MSKLSGRIVSSRFLGISSAILALLFTVGPAFGAGHRSRGARQSQEGRQSQEKAARKACLTGDYNSGVAILADLFIEYKSPVYVFNQGRCLEQNSRYKDAIARFEEFLRIGETATLEPDDRAAAEKHIADCKAKLPDRDKPQAMAAPPFVQPLPQPMPQPIPQPHATAQIVETPKVQPGPPKNWKGLLVGGIVTGGVGVVAVLAGVAFNVKANSMVNEMETVVDDYTSSKNSSQKDYVTLAWVGYGLGAACIATGAVLTVLGASRRGSSIRTEVALVPAVGPGQAGVLLHGGF